MHIWYDNIEILEVRNNKKGRKTFTDLLKIWGEAQMVQQKQGI